MFWHAHCSSCTGLLGIALGFFGLLVIAAQCSLSLDARRFWRSRGDGDVSAD